jgi:hypothetical protein
LLFAYNKTRIVRMYMFSFTWSSTWLLCENMHLKIILLNQNMSCWLNQFCFHLVVETDKYRTCWYISTLGCQNADYISTSLHGITIQKNNFVIFSNMCTSNFHCILISKKLFGWTCYMKPVSYSLFILYMTCLSVNW